jgi:pyruvate/2-oxoglutarate dehydrogenase complex dihydrolipoamide dehydrogenase (E3) component
MVVVGSGAIGLELAQFFARMGTRVHLVSRRRVFEKHEPLLAEELEAVLEAEPGLELVQPVAPRSVRPHPGGVEVGLADGERVVAETLVLATGREAALDGLGLAAAGVRLAEGRVERDAHQRTTAERVYVAGDATGDRQLLHVANWEGQAAGWNAAGGDPPRSIEGRVHVEVVFTDPPVALVGLTEREARALGVEPITATARLPETGRAITMEVRHGAFRLVARETDGKLLGAQLVGPQADEIAHVVAALVHTGAGVRDMLAMPWYHPTLSEVLLSLARDLAGRLRPAPPDGPPDTPPDGEPTSAAR